MRIQHIESRAKIEAWPPSSKLSRNCGPCRGSPSNRQQQNQKTKKKRSMILIEKWSSNHDTANGLYGDAMHMLSALAYVPLSGWRLYEMEPDDPKKTDAIYVYVAMFFGPIMCMLALLLKNVWFSRLGMLGGVTLNTLMNLTEWPHPGECTITALSQGVVLLAVMANISLSFSEKCIRLSVLFITASYISIHSPYSVYLEDTFPILGCTILGAIFVLYIYHFGVDRTFTTIQGARLCLAAIFLYHATVRLTSQDKSAYDNITKFVNEALVASIGIVATGTFQNEILQKQRLEILVQKRTQKLRMVNMALQASETAIAITDKWGSIVWLNVAFERLLGKKRKGLLGSLLKDVILNLDTSRKENKYLLMELYEDLSKPNEEELQIGESIFRIEATPFSAESHSNTKNKPVTENTPVTKNDRVLMVFKDITSRRARETLEKKAHHEAIMAKAMGESMMTLTHELRTPLQGIMGVTSMLQQQASEWKNNDALESLKLIMASSILLLNLINNLLDVRKTTAKMMEEFPLSSISASGPIKDAVGFCLPLASISNVKIVTDLGIAQNAIVKSNALRLQQVLINLVSNAIKYTKRGSDICIQIRTVMLSDVRRMVNDAIAPSSQKNDGRGGYDDESPMLVFSVSDCGPGIAPDQAGRLFHRYARLNTKSAKTPGSNVRQSEGTGLGLHLCQLFVERMNGHIWAMNNGKDAGGSSFLFSLPLVYDAAYGVMEDPGISNIRRLSISHAISIDNRNRLVEKNDEISLFDLRVLTVDDMLINRKVFDRMLKRLGIKNSVTVESGEKALEELSRNHYDLVITDLQMPGISGTELSAAIQSSVKNESSSSSALPIVVGLTADTSADVVGLCSESGMSDVLFKPITLTEMKDYFKMTLPNLKPGIWHNGNAHDIGMNVISMQISKKSAAKKNERLLLEVFPEKIAGALREGQRIKPEHHDIVTIYFSDIVGFTNISSLLTPIKVSSLLDRLYLKFDELSRKHDVFKIETIGDAYMAVTNLVKKQEDHVKRIANFSRNTIDAALTTLIDEENPELGYVRIRVGFHSGPVVSNVVGSRNPKFTIIGDTVNGAARMESNSLPLQIQCSEQSALILKDKHPDIPCILRGKIQVKGKGEMTTYWVHKKQSTTQGTPKSTTQNPRIVRNKLK